MSETAPQWSEEYATDLVWQDFQHQQLFVQLHELIRALEERRAPTVLDRILDYLEVYVHEHFGIEERYMESAEYADREEHRAEHERFVENLNGIKRYARPGTRVTAAVSLANDLRCWLHDHIKTLDRDLGRFLKEHPVD